MCETWLKDSQKNLFKLLDSTTLNEARENLIHEYLITSINSISEGRKETIDFGKLHLNNIILRFQSPEIITYFNKIIGVIPFKDSFSVCTDSKFNCLCTDGKKIYYGSDDGIVVEDKFISKISVKGIVYFKDTLYGFDEFFLYSWTPTGELLTKTKYKRKIIGLTVSSEEIYLISCSGSTNLLTQYSLYFHIDAISDKSLKYFFTFNKKELYVVFGNKKHKCYTFNKCIKQVQIHPHGRIAVVTDNQLYLF